jgi:Asp-tRNA(Asn)/Glu-tRNA(Gln) amidotransferase A subunit family amidase
VPAALSLPPGTADSGLPPAIRLIGAAATDARLLTADAWGEAVLGFAAIPRG